MTGIASAVNHGSRRPIHRRLVAVTGMTIVTAWTFTALPADASVTYPVTTVNVAAFPGAMAVDPLTHQVFVATEFATVSAINVATNAVATITIPSATPSGVAVDVARTFSIVNGVKLPVGVDTSTVYVTNVGGSVAVINPAAHAVTTTIALPGAQPEAIAIDASTHVAYITDRNGGIIVFNCTTNKMTAKLAVSGDLQSIAVDSTTHTIYAADTTGNAVVVINPATGATTRLSTTSPNEVAVDPTLHTLYVTSALGGVLDAIDETSSAVKSISVGGGPDGVAVDTGSHRVYVANGGSNTVSIVDGLTDTVIGTTPPLVDPTQGIADVAVDAATHTAYVGTRKANVLVIGRKVTPPALARLSGSDRYATAVAVSQSQFPTATAGAVVLARGTDYPDALVGAPLAKVNNAPLLLTSGAAVTAVTLAEIQRVLPAGKTVYVLGGPAAIPSTVETQLTDLGYQVVRYSGATRYATAVAVAAALGNPSTVLLATGANFPDALSAGVAAAKVGGVVLLTADATLPAETAAYLAVHAMKTYAVGGPAATADPNATALVGADRYQTAVDVAQQFFTAPTTVGVATGLAFPDALSGGAALGRLGAPLVLVATTSVPASASSYLTSIDAATTKGYLFGGPNTVTAATLTAVQSALAS